MKNIQVYVEKEQQKIIRVAENELLWSDKVRDLFLSSSPTSFIVAAQKGRESVVFIRGKKPKDSFSLSSFHQSGSGVIVSSDGYIVTNHHVVAQFDQIEVVLSDKRTFIAELRGYDENTDLALLKIESDNIPYLILGNSDSLQIGEWVLAVGNPFNLQSSVTAGIVSAKARNINMLESQGIESFIQTDAAVNPGSSGGALINTNGLLMGINTAIISENGSFEGFSFAIPANVVKKIVEDLKEFGVVQRGWLGVEIEDVDAEVAKRLHMSSIEGVLISSVSKDGAGQVAGLQKNDVVLKINDNKIHNTAEFMENISRYRPSEEIRIELLRKNNQISVKAVLRNHLNSLDPIAVYKTGVLQKLGIEVRNLDALEKTLFGKQGVLVVSVQQGSPVFNSKLEPGFIIQSMDGIVVKNAASLMESLQSKLGEEIVWEGIYKNFPGTYPYVFRLPE
ncbi:MAG: trypsin-like peptidase domain-containing protein [Saprospiraceae bacterium]